ncbi:MAG: methyltransferase domain-containing protein [archaeon]
MERDKVRTKGQQFEFIRNYDDPEYIERRNIGAVEKELGVGIRKEIARRLKKQSKVRVLNLGCGSAQDLLDLRKEFGRRIEVHGLNSRPPEKTPNQPVSRDSKFIKAGNMAERHFPKNFFDIVYSTNTLFYVPDKLGAIKANFECVKPGGIMVLSNVWGQRMNGVEAKIENLIDMKRSAGMRVDLKYRRFAGPAKGDRIRITKLSKDARIEFRAQFKGFKMEKNLLPFVTAHYTARKNMHSKPVKPGKRRLA